MCFELIICLTCILFFVTFFFAACRGVACKSAAARRTCRRTITFAPFAGPSSRRRWNFPTSSSKSRQVSPAAIVARFISITAVASLGRYSALRPIPNFLSPYSLGAGKRKKETDKKKKKKQYYFTFEWGHETRRRRFLHNVRPAGAFRS